MDRVGPFDPSTLTVPYGTLAAWRNAAPASGIEGSVPSVEAWIHAIEEIVYCIEQSGQTPDHTNLHQLKQAIVALAVQGVTGSGQIPVILQNPTLYVSTSGSDTTGNGTQASPFATIQAALNYGVSRYQFAGFTLTIQLATAGTYAVPNNIPRGCSNLAIVGSTSNPSGYVLSGAGSSAAGGVLVVQGVSLNLSGLTLLNSSNITHTLTASSGGSVNISYVRLQLATAMSYSHIFAGPNGSISIGPGCSFVNGGSSYALFAGGGSILLSSNPITVGGGAAFGVAFAFTQGSGSNIVASSGASFTSPGSVTGKRFICSLKGTINTYGAGPNFFPGDTAGTTDENYQYA